MAPAAAWNANRRGTLTVMRGVKAWIESHQILTIMIGAAIFAIVATIGMSQSTGRQVVPEGSMKAGISPSAVSHGQFSEEGVDAMASQAALQNTSVVPSKISYKDIEIGHSWPGIQSHL